MRISSTPARLTAFVLVVVLLVILATPAEANAEFLTAVAIATAVVAGVLLIAYLIVANVSDARRADEGRIVWVAMSGPGPVQTP